MNNKRNKRNYRWLSKVYDFFIQNRWFEKARQREFQLADIQPNQRVLIIGIGTGLDLPYISNGAKITGIDLSREMLQRIEKKRENHDLQLFEMGAEQLNFPDQYYDVIIMNLILSVVENPQLAIKEAYRVLKPEGNIWVLDKFLEPNQSIRPVRKLLNQFTRVIATDINRSLEVIVAQVPLTVHYKEPAIFGSTFQIIQLKKDQIE